MNNQHILYDYFINNFNINYYYIRTKFLNHSVHWIFPYSLIRNNIISDIFYYQDIDDHFFQHDIYSVIKNYLEP